MAMESYMNGVTGSLENPVQTVKAVEGVKKAPTPKEAVRTTGDQDIESIVALMNGVQEKEPAESTIDSAVSSVNAKMSKTRCAYAYDKDTKRVTIKVYDDETDELIREVPPEKSLEALKKIWELAGIIIDEKR